MTDTLVTADYPDELLEIDLRETPRDQLVAWLETMILVREFEGSLEPLTINGKIPGSVHLAVGQEAAAVGAIRALKPGDIVASGHRGHHHGLALGLTPRAVMAELFGRATGCAGGRGGTMHLADFTINYFGGNGIVGAGLGLAMGGALAAKLRGTNQIALGFFGDGGANTGRTWEAVNMAAVWTLPLIAFCENNLYAVETSIGRAAASGSIAERAAGFGLPAVQVDGQDVCAVYRAVRAARERAEAGEGPTFVEALTYRYHGHNTGEVTTYRTEDEVEQWRRSRDPLQRLRRALEEERELADGQVTRMQEEASERVRDAVEYADSSPWPDNATASENVFGPDIASRIRP